ncbi:hypothetical protein V2E39_22815 [Chryseobacterium arthrosphaerae]|uniref:Uncharacterized protein n=1 Tax=Chryseobacterium arthrosphaerae TaxID=651561 RepID=A0ABU7R633_9FLAO
MKYLKLKAEYIVKSDMIKMLQEFIKELQNNDDTILFEINSNFGGKMKVDLKTEVLPDLRQNHETVRDKNK